MQGDAPVASDEGRPSLSRVRVVVAVARDPALRRVELAFFGFNMTEYATWIAILVFAYRRGGAPEAGVVALVQLIPAGIVAPFASFAGDRYRRERVLLAGYGIQAVALGVAALALAMDLSIVVIYGAATVTAVSLTLTRPTHASLLPGITRTPENLTAANAVSALAESAGICVGPFVAGILLTWSGPATVFAVFGFITAGGALLVSGLRAEKINAVARDGMNARGMIRETSAGFRALGNQRAGAWLLLVLVAGVGLLGALDVLFVAVAVDLLGKGDGWAGFLNSAFGLGGVIGAGTTVALVGRRRLMPPFLEASMLFGAPIVLVGAAPGALTTPALFAATGAGRMIASVAGNTLLQRMAPDAVLSRVFGVFEGLGMLALALGSLTASSLIETVGIRTALVVSGAFIPVIVLLLLKPLLRIDRNAAAPDPDNLALLRGLPIFAPLPAPAVERVMANLVRLELPEGTEFIREGDSGDRFYVIVHGDVAVRRAGMHIANLHRGDYVGEIALMRDIPRTATAIATSPVTLLALERGPFLEAVTGYSQSRERLDAAIEGRLADLT